MGCVGALVLDRYTLMCWFFSTLQVFHCTVLVFHCTVLVFYCTVLVVYCTVLVFHCTVLVQCTGPLTGHVGVGGPKGEGR